MSILKTVFPSLMIIKTLAQLMLVNKAVSIEDCFGLRIGNWGQAHMSASSKSIHLGIDNNNNKFMPWQM